jgi:hypothetical protein
MGGGGRLVSAPARARRRKHGGGNECHYARTLEQEKGAGHGAHAGSKPSQLPAIKIGYAPHIIRNGTDADANAVFI